MSRSRATIGAAAQRSRRGEPWTFALLRIALAAICLLPPTLLMGGTLPLVVRGLRLAPETAPPPADPDAGRRPGHTRSAATPRCSTARTRSARSAASPVAGFLTIPLFGLHASLLLSAALNFAAALGALALARRRRRSARGRPTQGAAFAAVHRKGAAFAARLRRAVARRPHCSSRRCSWGRRAWLSRCSGRASSSSISARASTPSA